MDQYIEFVSNNLILFAALVVILALLVKSFIGTRGVKSVGPADAIKLINHEDAVVLDVRTDDEYRDGHILNSIHIPVGLLQNKLGDLDQYKSRPIIVNCRTGHRAATAGQMLHKQGFDRIYKLEGGTMAWQNANLPLSKKR